MGIFGLLLFLGVLSRIVPHPANFTIVGALLIFYGAKKGYKGSAILGLSIMVISDILLGFNFASPFVYLGFLAYVMLSKIYNKKLGLIIAPTLASFAFFIISNFGVWLGPWYTHDSSGLAKCFTLALPFYRNTFMGDIIFSIVIYLSYRALSNVNFNKYFNTMEEKWQKLLVRTILKRR